MSDRRTTIGQAVAGYDEAFEKVLVDAITTAIAEASRTTDCACIALRTGETASALLTTLAMILAMSPAATRSPTAIRTTVDQLGKRLRRRIAAAEKSADLTDFLKHCFRDDVGGHA